MNIASILCPPELSVNSFTVRSIQDDSPSIQFKQRHETVARNNLHAQGAGNSRSLRGQYLTLNTALMSFIFNLNSKLWRTGPNKTFFVPLCSSVESDELDLPRVWKDTETRRQIQNLAWGGVRVTRVWRGEGSALFVTSQMADLQNYMFRHTREGWASSAPSTTWVVCVKGKVSITSFVLLQQRPSQMFSC